MDEDEIDVFLNMELKKYDQPKTLENHVVNDDYKNVLLKGPLPKYILTDMIDRRKLQKFVEKDFERRKSGKLLF